MWDSLAAIGLLFTLPLCALAAEPLVLTSSHSFRPGEVITTPLVIGADDIRIEGNGAILKGPGIPGRLDTYVGSGISSKGHSRVTIRDLTVVGFRTGLQAEDGRDWVVEGCTFSDNYHDPSYGWGEGGRCGGIVLTGISSSRITGTTAQRVWNACDLRDCHDNLIEGNVFSHASNTCLKLWHSCRNRILKNDLSWGLRIAPGEVHARDSAGVLIESGSDDNYFEGNDITHGGDGIFIRVLNGWVSTGNVFVENDCSYANNNCIESWAPGNTFIRNRANHGSYGFWMGGSDRSVLIENEAAFNGLESGFHNAPEPGFGHGGIVFVNGTSYHTRVIGNYCHDNNGGGIVLRGDRATKGEAWKAHHWIIADNRLERNRWGIYAQHADWVFLAGNVSEGNREPDVFDGVTRVVAPPPDTVPPVRAVLKAPSRVTVGDAGLLDASASVGAEQAEWDIGGTPAEGLRVFHRFTQPGFCRVGLTVWAGDRADLAWADVYVVEPGEGPATEDNAHAWSAFAHPPKEGAARDVGPSVRFTEDREVAIAGASSVRMRVERYGGHPIEAVVTASLVGDLGRASALALWVKWRNENAFGFDGPNPVIRLRMPEGTVTLTPGARNLLSGEGETSEARWGWARLVVPLDGEGWERKVEGREGAVLAVGFLLRPVGDAPYTVWFDGLTVQ